MSDADLASAPSLAANLRFAASFLPSVSQLCRDVGLNRQQMNKYLNGGSRPSPYNLRRIAGSMNSASSSKDLCNWSSRIRR